MSHWYARPVFFVTDVSRALGFYTEQLGFGEDWTFVEEGEVLVAQVSREGFELILNKDPERSGRGRIYFHLTDLQVATLREEVARRGLGTASVQWGMPITEILDPDGNQLYFDDLFGKAPEPT